LEPGDYILKSQAKDGADNMGESAEVTFTVEPEGDDDDDSSDDDDDSSDDDDDDNDDDSSGDDDDDDDSSGDDDDSSGDDDDDDDTTGDHAEGGCGCTAVGAPSTASLISYF
jgi:hypothetical protein